MKPLRRLSRYYGRCLNNNDGWMNNFVQSLRTLNVSTIYSFARHSKDIQTSLAPFNEEIGRAFHELPERNREALRVLAANGWYFDPELPFSGLFQVADLFEEGEEEQANQMLCTHFEQRLSDIQETIRKRFPNRARVLGAALDSHLRGDYALSIPVLLAQSDGICHELVGAQLYARRNGTPLLATYLTIDDGMSLQASFLCPLVEPTPISAGPTERAPDRFLLSVEGKPANHLVDRTQISAAAAGSRFSAHWTR